jgi:nitroreductase
MPRPPSEGLPVTAAADAGADRPGAPAWVDHLVAPRAEPARDGVPPDRQALERILETATTVPDHGGLRPWRFAVIAGAGRDRFGDALVAGLYEAKGPDVPDAAVAKMRPKAFAAPCAVAMIASPDPASNVPVWEQVASAACTGYAMVLAATGLGYGAVWKSAAVIETGPVRSLFALTVHEQLLGWVNVGSPAPVGTRKAGAAPADLGGLVTVIGDPAGVPFSR